jgi:hypothetical protein
MSILVRRMPLDYCISGSEAKGRIEAPEQTPGQT